MKSRKHNKFSPVDAKVALLRRGLTVSSLAKGLKRPRPTVSAVINGSARFPRLKQLVIAALFS